MSLSPRRDSGSDIVYTFSMTQAATEHPTVARVTTELLNDEIGAEETGDFSEFEDDEGDEEEEPEEIARRLKEQLWADISKAQAAQANERLRISQPSSGAETTQYGLGCAASTSRRLHPKVSAALETMKTILALTEKDPEARCTLSSASVPGLNEIMQKSLVLRLFHWLVPARSSLPCEIRAPLRLNLTKENVDAKMTRRHS